MNPPNPNIIFEGQPTPSEKLFMISWSTDLNVGVSLNSGTAIESTESDAQSAPPFDEILESITNISLTRIKRKAITYRMVHAGPCSGSKWIIFQYPSQVYDLQGKGTLSWLWEEIVNILDLINYVF